MTTIAGPTVTPLPTESPPCWRSASTRTTLLDTGTKVAGCSTCAKADGANSSPARMTVSCGHTMEAADALYGITMRGDGVSAVISQQIAARQPA